MLKNTRILNNAYSIKPRRTTPNYRTEYLAYQIEGNEITRYLSIEQNLKLFKNRIWKLIDYRKKQGEWKVILEVLVDFKSTKIYPLENTSKYTVSNSNFISEADRTKDIVNRLYLSLLDRYEYLLENAMEGSDYVFNNLLASNIKFHKSKLSRGGTYIPTWEWILNKKATINPMSKDNKCFQHAKTIAMHYQEIGKNSHRIVQRLSRILIIAIGKTLNFLQNQLTVKHLT